MALTQNDEIIEDMFPFDQASATPDKLRKVFRSGAYRGTTAAMADGYTQGNLAIIPQKYALDFARFCQRNPQPCPMICLLYTSPSPRDGLLSRMPSSA